MTLSGNQPLVLELGTLSSLPAAAQAIYESAALSLRSDGTAGNLVVGEKFLGHCKAGCDNSGGAAGDKNVEIQSGLYKMVVALTTAAGDIGRPVYATDENTYTLDPAGASGPNTLVGVVHRRESASKAVVTMMPATYQPQSEAGSVIEFFDDFLGIDGALTKETGSVGVWSTVDVGDATEAAVADAHGGAMALVIAATSEAEDAVLYFGDQLNFDIDSLLRMEFRAKFITPGSGVTIVAGMAGDHNLDKDTVAQNAWFRCEGGLALVAESDDGTTDTDDVAIATITTNVWYDFAIDFSDKSALKFFLNGTQVATAGTFSLAAYTGGLQPYFSADKASGTGTGQLIIDYVRILARRG